jgi:prepilin-type N-terminal cleavage/methylation domain-containing protein
VDKPAIEPRESGFTLVEMIVVISITAFVFLALAAFLAGGMRSLGVAKARSHGIEVATQGIEDLQRYDFNNLGVCSGSADPAPSTVPSGLTGLTSVALANCGSASLVYEQPCSPPAGTLTTFAVPRQTYSCVRYGITYRVSRYIVWADTNHTAKRLAVFVGWNDQVGTHQVAQESSLRSPNAASVIGLAPPQFVSASVTGANPAAVADDGTLLSTLTFTATTNALTAADNVYVTLNTLTTQPDGTVAALPTQFPLQTSNGADWSLTLPGTSAVPKFGAGSQYVTFTEVRSSGDGKANSKIGASTVTFCPAAGCPSGLPTISGSVSPTSINIDSSGVLQSTFTVSANTSNLTNAASVTMTFQTQTGAASLPLQASSSCPAGGSCNNWSTTVSAGSVNFRFLPGNQVVYLTATEPVSGSGGTNGSSAVATTNTVAFG